MKTISVGELLFSDSALLYHILVDNCQIVVVVVVVDQWEIEWNSLVQSSQTSLYWLHWYHGPTFSTTIKGVVDGRA